MINLAIRPTGQSDRIVSLDVLRGFALLGILVMNIQSFAMVQAAYMNPTAFGDLTGANYWVWHLSHMMADQKFMTLFSMLFGAGIILFAERVEAKGGRAASMHYRRMFWLLVIGLCHAYLVWHGDVLVAYAVCGCIVFLLRKLWPRLLVVLGILAILVPTLLSIGANTSMPYWPPEELEKLSEDWYISQEAIDERIAVLRGPWIGQLPKRARACFYMETFIFSFQVGWRAGGCMLIGMALYRLNVLNGNRSARFYLWLTAVGLGTGWPMIAYGIHRNFAADWDIRYSFFIGSQFNYWGSLAVAIGYVGVINLVCRTPLFAWAARGLAAVGRMALTNYLMQSLVCSWIFYGQGLGMYCAMTRVQQLCVVLCIWVFQIMFSNLWFRRFRFGPFEWLWRSLSYGRVQPFLA